MRGNERLSGCRRRPGAARRRAASSPLHVERVASYARRRDVSIHELSQSGAGMTAASSDPGSPALEYGLVAHARIRPGKVALVSGEERLTYGDLNASVNRLVRVLAAAGVGAGHRVALMVRNSFAFFQVGQAAAKLRATVVPINFHLKH